MSPRLLESDPVAPADLPWGSLILVDDPDGEPEPEQCEHYRCCATAQPGMECGRGYTHCCGCCDGDPDAAWEAWKETW